MANFRIEPPSEVLRRHGLSPRKSWGQNFLHDPNVHRAIVSEAMRQSSPRIVEIGAGLGSLTAHLLSGDKEVWAIERDRDLCQVLRAEFSAAPNFRLFEADAVRFDYASAREPGQPPVTIVGNLPYQLTGALLFALLEFQQDTGAWIVMVQREVAERLAAAPGSKTYGGATAALSRWRSISLVCHVGSGAFLPPPKVDSAVIRLDPRDKPLGEVADEEGYRKLVRTAFQQRRKTITNTLRTLAEREDVLAWCEEAGIDPQARPETLAPQQFAALQRAREKSHA
jgi:16S rRNA (adenine1518-N6/adenine1519-N6)-dimethyltransferase